MSIDRGDRIIVMMIRSVCCCARSSQVADASEEVIGKQQLKNKSHLLKEEKRRQLDDVWMILVVRGREAQQRVTDCIKSFKTQYALHKNDIYWTDNEQQAKHEENLWFKDDEIVVAVGTSNGEVAAVVGGAGEAAVVVQAAPVEEHNGIAPAEIAKVDAEIIHSSEVNSVVSSEGPHISIASSQIPSPIPMDTHHGVHTPHPTIQDDIIKEEVEVISNTADILEPIPSPVPPVIIHQPTKIE
ncbi:hypothetical protein CAEBREN_15189 [Caenorhabditis brenneri]|uniref:Uncharacterized protein n=1 Tax=Caenorhabditis brenneri TaxID=135651 RepID=G0NUE7_CAEBE|nr:hypothetical protein CAEBREN_15189 [Caenorhabditis brenneri]